MPELKGDIPNLRLFVSIKCILWLLTHSHCLYCKNNTLRMSRANGNSIPFIKASRCYLSLSFSQPDLRGDVYPPLSLVLLLNSGLVFFSSHVFQGRESKRKTKGSFFFLQCTITFGALFFGLVQYQRFDLDRIEYTFGM